MLKGAGFEFRVLDSPPRTAAEHMALDEVIVNAHSKGLIPNTLRFLQFKPCALVGLHQNVHLEVNVPYCIKNGLDINRRITGGGSLYWGPMELGWELYAAKDTPGIPRKVQSMYKLLCEGMAVGLQKLGLNAAYRPVNDIEISGRKICGTGGTELNSSFVFQCSLIVDFDIEEMLKVLRMPIEKMGDKAIKTMSKRVTSIREQLGFVPPHQELKVSILEGLGKTLGQEFYQGELTNAETAMFAERLPYFQSDDWVYGKNDDIVYTVDCISNYKAPGGLIRIQMRLDDNLRLIKYLIINGDFFAYPARVINDLENALKNTPIEERRIADIIHDFFKSNTAEIPGVSPEHFVEAVLLAIKNARANRIEDGQRLTL